MNDAQIKPLPYDEATPAQHTYIIKLVCDRLNEPWTRPPMDKVAAYLNEGFDVDLDHELEPLSKIQASQIISALQ